MAKRADVAADATFDACAPTSKWAALATGRLASMLFSATGSPGFATLPAAAAIKPAEGPCLAAAGTAFRFATALDCGIADEKAA